MKILYCSAVFLILLNIYLAIRLFRRNNQKLVVSEEKPRVPCHRAVPGILVADGISVVVMSHREYRELPCVTQVDSSLLCIGDRVRLDQDEEGWHRVATFESIDGEGIRILVPSRVCFDNCPEA